MAAGNDAVMPSRRIGITAIEAALAKHHAPLARRTLQRRLDALLQQQKITAGGGSRSIVYRTAATATALKVEEPAPRSAPIPESSAATPAFAPDSEPYPALSPAASEIRNYVRRSLSQRRPVGYQREFLKRYRPNRDTYLSRPQIAHLLEAGHTPFDARPAGTYARAILDRLLIDLSWASSRLEGNTYNRLDTQWLIEFGQAAVGKPAHETQMILNHKAAIEMLIEGDTGFNRFTIMNLHALLSDNLLADPAAGGRLRRCEVGISGTV